MTIELFEHNRQAYGSAVAMMNDTSKAAIIHPTGTGKSFIAFKLCEDNPDKRICWLSPSDYIYQTQLENLKRSTDGYAPENISFHTYSKLILMTEEEIEAIRPDYIILDEFHRCGARVWQQAITKLTTLFPYVPVMGLSATAIRYLDNRRDMADEIFDGNIASYMSLGEAIVRGILPRPKYVMSYYEYGDALKRYRDEIRRAKSRITRDTAEEYYEALRRALEKADRLDEIFARHMEDRKGKYIVFCSSREHMERMMEKAPEWFSKVDGAPHIYGAYHDDPGTGKAFKAFREDDSGHLKLLFCIDMLNEGIHVEDISGVILLRPTVSPIIYRQQIGRALSAGEKRAPVIFDIVMNIDNLCSIDALEGEMRESVGYLQREDREEEIVNDRFTLVDELGDSRALFRKLDEAMSASWERMYAIAATYREENGHLDVPKRYVTKEGYTLGSWLSVQRRIYNGKAAGALSEERVSKLEAIGMAWESPRDASWEMYLTAAKGFYKEHGHLLVSAEHVTEDGIYLGRWISRIRGQRKAGKAKEKFTDERIAALEEIGMVWDVSQEAWMKNYRAAVQYHRTHGHLDVPSSYVDEDGVALGQWIFTMRTARRQTEAGLQTNRTITEEQIRLLDRLGMIWDTKSDRSWAAGFEQAAVYYREHGDLKVPATYRTADGFNLGKWLYRQRTASPARMDAERRRKLDEIGMVWG